MCDKLDSTTQMRPATQARPRENAKKVKTYHATNWGGYNVSFLVLSTDGAQDVPRFLKQMDALSVKGKPL